MARILSRGTLILLLAVLAGCGFRLAGSTPLPAEVSRIYLVTDDFDRRQQDALLDRLRRAGADVSLEPAGDRVKLSVKLKTVSDERVVSGAGRGKSVKRVSRKLDYSLRGADGNLLTDVQTLTQQTEIRFDEDNLLSSSEEKDLVVEDLEKALYDQLVRQLQSI